MTNVWLGLIAVSVLLMAISQLGALVYAARLTRRVERLTTHIEQDLKPVFTNLQAVSSEAARAVVVAGAQVDRAEKLFADLAAKVEQAADIVPTRLLGPAREGAALLAGLRGALAAFRVFRQRRPHHSTTPEPEDALFIG